MSKSVFLFILFLTIMIPLSCGILFYKNVIKKHKKRRATYSEKINDSDIDCDSKNILIMIIDKTFECISNYFFYQVISKMVDIWGVGFTILTIVSLKSVDGSEIQLATAIVAAILVIAAVYVNPITRAKEYLYAWRKYKPQSFKIISNVTKFQNDHDKLELIVKESIKLSRDIEADFRSEEE